MFENNLIAGVSGQGGGYSINDSLRFNDDDSAYLSRTPATAGNRKTWTWSGWVKRGNSGAVQRLFTAGSDSNNYTILQFKATNELYLATVSSGIVYGEAQTTSQLNDPSGWYHIIFSFDADNAVGADRLKIYVNGVSQTLSITDTIENNSSYHKINQAVLHNVGARSFVNTSNTFDGYLAEINFIDGQALTPDDFGEINATTGEWSPIAYSGTYGTNGFYLPFDGNANDDSGNGNNWTENNLASTDYMIDTPTNNFSVLNPDTTMTISEGNLKATTTTLSTWQSVVNTIGVSSGKWYFETCAPQALSSPPYAEIGITTNSNFGQNAGNNYLGSTADSWGYINNGKKYNNASNVIYGATYTNGDVIGCALDMDAGTVTFYKNNVSQGVAFTGLSGTMFCGASVYTTSATASNNINFGADSSFAGNKTRQGNTDANGIGDFYYAPPAGFLALCEDNLPTSGVVASGGTETTIIDGGRYYKVHTFTSSDTFTVSSGGEVEYLVVAGGGGGGSGSGGGGGAGGYRSSVVGESSGGGASAEPKLTVSVGSFTVTVGAGGGSNASGSDSVFSTINSTGGGNGGFIVSGGNGGSGGGGGGIQNNVANTTGGIALAGQGNNGGAGRSTSSSTFGGGGGGGAGQVGGNCSTSSCGSGGNGLVSSITGTGVTRGGGGGGGTRGNASISAGLGGSGGGGNGKKGDGGAQPNPGVTNTGGGGGGGARGSSGGNGGSGVVIIRYAV